MTLYQRTVCDMKRINVRTLLSQVAFFMFFSSVCSWERRVEFLYGDLILVTRLTKTFPLCTYTPFLFYAIICTCCKQLMLWVSVCVLIDPCVSKDSARMPVSHFAPHAGQFPHSPVCVVQFYPVALKGWVLFSWGFFSSLALPNHKTAISKETKWRFSTPYPRGAQLPELYVCLP